MILNIISLNSWLFCCCSQANQRIFLKYFSGTKRKSNTSESVDDHFTYPGVVEEKLGKLKEKIWETKLRLEALRDRRKKLLMISTRDRPIEYLCPCSPGNSSSIRNGAQEFGYDNDNKGTHLKMERLFVRQRLYALFVEL